MFLGIPPGALYRAGAGSLMKEPRKQERLLANSLLIYAEKLKSRAASWGEKFQASARNCSVSLVWSIQSPFVYHVPLAF